MTSLDEPKALLAMAPAGPEDRRLALGTAVLSLALFVIAVPFAKEPLARVDAFIPAYEAALLITDLMTVVLLLGQYEATKSRALLVLACGYLFTGLMVIPHAMTFPGLFAPTGLLGAGPRSTAWIYMFWHSGFPIFVLGFALLKDRDDESAAIYVPGANTMGQVVAVLGVVCLIVFMLAWVATTGKGMLPSIM